MMHPSVEENPLATEGTQDQSQLTAEYFYQCDGRDPLFYQNSFQGMRTSHLGSE